MTFSNTAIIKYHKTAKIPAHQKTDPYECCNPQHLNATNFKKAKRPKISLCCFSQPADTVVAALLVQANSLWSAKFPEIQSIYVN